ncbi:hypothetical protein Acy02nite_83680 [Actinoplanes cyaneus]|uniref:Uncharacterized protein n=1 Tax=Actinoplanes cyaneus TaxID=52696 RepID=A0A919IU17_9ACTN|nr:hypothetical protein [Actinoplanes cyaneus]MCW2138218.1 hypothetical protein [Actinoplanes cyaneus]GID70487.1 hypothetical protein Acy02nite_83680 [Actinoplanes cyaneus]
MPAPYFGETHGCYSDSLQMALGFAGPGAGTLEVLSCSPFGMTVHDGMWPYFAPANGWNPEVGMRTALDLLGWACDQHSGDLDHAVSRMREATEDAPVLAGPFEMGLLPYHPGLGQPMNVDHYLVVLGLDDDDMVLLHDPRAHPYTLVPLKKLLVAWDTSTLSFRVEPYNVRSNFRRVRETPVSTALREMLPLAARFLGDPAAAAAAAAATTDLVANGLTTPQYFHMTDFMVCAGVRRRLEAAVHLDSIGCHDLARVLQRQARIIGSSEYFLVAQDYATAAEHLSKLGPTFGELHAELLTAAAR